MMRLQPFDRRRMTGFAVGLSLCGDDNPAPFLFFLRREKSDAPVRLRASFPLRVPFFLRRICVPLTKKALVKGRRFPVRPVFISDPRVALLHPPQRGGLPSISLTNSHLRDRGRGSFGPSRARESLLQIKEKRNFTKGKRSETTAACAGRRCGMKQEIIRNIA